MKNRRTLLALILVCLAAPLVSSSAMNSSFKNNVYTKKMVTKEKTKNNIIKNNLNKNSNKTSLIERQNNINNNNTSYPNYTKSLNILNKNSKDKKLMIPNNLSNMKYNFKNNKTMVINMKIRNNTIEKNKTLNINVQLENIMKDLGNERNKLRLGVPPMIGSIILPYIYRDFCKLYPNITLEIVEDGRSGLLDKLSENYLDMIFLLHNNSLDAKFKLIKIARLEIVCCASKDSPIAQFKSVTPDILKDTSLVLFENSFFQTEEIKKWFTLKKVNPNIIMQTKQLSTMLTMISNNVAVGFTFRDVANTKEDFVAIPLKEPMYVTASLVWKKDAYSFGCMEKFKKYVKEKNPFDAIIYT